MERTNIIERIKKILSNESYIDDDSKIGLESRLSEDLGLDSLDSMEMVMKLEEEFGVSFGEQEENFRTVGDAVNKVKYLLSYQEKQISQSLAQPSKSHSKFYAKIKVDKSDVEEANFNPYYIAMETGLGRKVIAGGKEVISFGSNDYLGIANSLELKKAMQEAVEKYGVSMCGTPIVIGQTDINKNLERKIAEFLGKQDALVFPSGYQANVGLFQTLAGREDIIIADKYAHSSLLSGMSLTKAKLRTFKHNDVKDLEKILRENESSASMKFVVVEGLYSTEGDTSPLDQVADISKKYNAFLIVDDSHGTGVLGKNGRGTAEFFGVTDKVDLITGSLGKALGCFGGFISTNSEIADALRYKMGALIYSTALPPAMASASLASIDLVENADDRRKKLYDNKKQMYKSLKELGYNLTPSSTPLFSVICGTNLKTLEMTRDLYQKGVYGTPFLIPSVPKGRALIRFIPHANLISEDLNYSIKAFKEIKNKK